MASPSHPSKESPAPLLRGEYHPPTTTDLRSPCPIVNAFANHGLIPRDGRNVHPADLDTAMQDLGLSLPIRKTLIWGAFFECQDQLPATFKDYLTNPFAYLHWHFGIRPPGQNDSSSSSAQQKQQHPTPCIHLDQLSRHGAIEHDVSMTRRDFAQQATGADNHSPQPDLIAQLLHSSTDGSYLTTADFATLRRQRLEQQRHDNPELCFPWILHFVAAGQIAAVQRVFGQGERGGRVPVGFAEAIFREERLPVEEGWRRRGGWGLGVLGVVVQQVRVRVGIGKAMG